jgi:hypothetical protein
MAKKGVAKRRGGGTATADPPATLSMGKTDGDPNQSQLEGFEEERDQNIESLVSAIVNNKTRIKETQEKNKELVDELSEAMHAKGLTSYRCAGRVVTLIAGEESIQIKKAKASKSE